MRLIGRFLAGVIAGAGVTIAAILLIAAFNAPPVIHAPAAEQRQVEVQRQRERAQAIVEEEARQAQYAKPGPEPTEGWQP